MEKKTVLGVTLGNTAGVGPEIVAKVAAKGLLTEYARPIIPSTKPPTVKRFLL